MMTPVIFRPWSFVIRLDEAALVLLVGARRRFEEIANSDQEIAEGCAQIVALCGLAHNPCFGQPALLGLPETIVALFVRDELA